MPAPEADAHGSDPTFDRTVSLGRMASETYDVLVVGGGITGAGVALDAASRGWRTALVERDDFASGTSSKSSKLVHGGLRYLQQKEFRLVYENLRERQRLLENAPHLVEPIPFLIPLFGRGGLVDSGVARVYRSALRLYDLTGGIRIGHRYERVDRDRALAHLPTLNADRLVAGFLYWDARTDDARLTLAVLRTAALQYGAVVANHARVVGFERDRDGRVTSATIRPDGGSEFTIRARSVVNATGVWADDASALVDGRHPRTLRPAKGIHITVPAAALPCDIAAVFPVRRDRRSIFVVPWGEQTYIGTTDTAYEGPLDEPGALPDDVDYLIGAVNDSVGSKIARSDVTGVWAGLRPLLAPAEGRRASERTADLSRRHRVTTDPSGVVTVTGGKLTTYRQMAEDAVDQVGALLGERRRCRTRTLRLQGFQASAPSSGAVPVGDVHGQTLRTRHGAEADDVLALAADRPDLLEPLVPGLPYLAVEAVHAVRSEMATDLFDVLDRRTRASLRDAAAASAAADSVARLIAPDLGWDGARIEAEVARYRAATRHIMATAGLDGTRGEIGTGGTSVGHAEQEQHGASAEGGAS